MAGVLEIIPLAGWTTALITIATVGMRTHSHWIWLAALLGLWRKVMDYGIAPHEIPPAKLAECGASLLMRTISDSHRA
jgi:hypothetical protein